MGQRSGQRGVQARCQWQITDKQIVDHRYCRGKVRACWEGDVDWGGERGVVYVRSGSGLVGGIGIIWGM
jgi:hypothetical protein